MTSTSWSPTTFMSAIFDMYSADSDASQKAIKELTDFKENDLLRFILFCSQILEETTDEQTLVLKFTATQLKNFFEIKENRSKERIKSDWFSLTDDSSSKNGEKKEAGATSVGDIRDNVRNALIEKLICSDPSVRSICAEVLALICEIDEGTSEEIIKRFLQSYEEKDQLNPEVKDEYFRQIFTIDSTVKFFTELFRIGYFKHNSVEVNEIIGKILTDCITSLNDGYPLPDESPVMSQKTIILFIQQTFENCPFYIDDSNIIAPFFDNINEIMSQNTTDSSIYTIICNTVFSFIKMIYDSPDVMGWWTRIMDIILPIMNNETSNTSPDAKNSIMFLLYEVADLEHKYIKQKREIKGLIGESAPNLIEPVLNALIEPLEEGCEYPDTIEDIEEKKEHFYASAALNEITRISQDIVSDTIFSFIETFLLSNKESLNTVHAALLATAALTYGPINMNYAEKLYSLLQEGSIADFANHPNLRIRETALYTIYRIIKKYKIQDNEISMVMNILENNSNSVFEIKKRCCDIFKQICSSDSWDFNGKIDDLISLAQKLSECETNHDENIITPFIGISYIIEKYPETEENFPVLLNLLGDSVAYISGKDNENHVKPEVFYRKSYIIIIDALCKKMGSNIGEHSDEVMQSLVDSIDFDSDQYDDELCQDTLTAISHLLDANPVSQSFYTKMIEIFDRIQDNGDKSAVIASFRLLGKYISKAKPPLSDNSATVLSKVLNLLNSDRENGDLLLNVLQLLAQVCVSFQTPTDDTVKSAQNIMELAMECSQIIQESQQAQASVSIIQIYARFYDIFKETQTEYLTSIYKKVLEFARKIYDKFYWDQQEDEEIIQFAKQQFLFHSTGLILNISRALGRSCNMVINKKRYVDILIQAMNSNNPSDLINFAQRTLKRIRNS